MQEHSDPNKLYIGLAGLGTVGGGLVSLLKTNADIIRKRTGRSIILKKVLVRDLNKSRKVDLPDDVVVTTNPYDLTDDPTLDAVVELIGGQDTAKLIIDRALDSGKDVVTANKALLAENGANLFQKAYEKGRILRYEASVAGAIPIVQTLKDSLASNRILSVIGILNGTSNYILSRMTAQNLDFATALKEAQDLGFAEADPSLDIDGFDTAHKLCLLIRLAFGVQYNFSDISVQGIRNLNALDIQLANELGYHIKLIGQVREVSKDLTKSKLEAGVFPALVPLHFLLARVDGSFNALHIKANAADSLFFHGRGAGALPTASAVLADLLAVARREAPNNTGYFATNLPQAETLPHGDASSCYYMRIMVEDCPGVLRDIAACMAREGINMSHVVQRMDAVPHKSPYVPLVILAHETTAMAMTKAIDAINKLNLPKEPIVSFRVLA